MARLLSQNFKPIQQQPFSDNVKNPQPEQPKCPYGLDSLIPVSSLYIKQKTSLLETLTGFETENKYEIKNEAGETILWAAEHSDVLSRNCCGNIRPFEMSIVDAQKIEIIHLIRDFACDSCLFPCCLQRMEVYDPRGRLIGTIEQEWNICATLFVIKDETGKSVLEIEGGYANFIVYSSYECGRTEIGKISKEWSGLARELFTDSDFFGVLFPSDLDARMKAALLAAVFLIDFTYYEN